MNKKLSVVMLSSEYLPEVFGGVQAQCQKLSEELVKKGIIVTVLTNRKTSKIKATEITNGVKIVRLLCYGRPHMLTAKNLHCAIIWSIKVFYWAAKNRNKYDIVHVHQAKLQAYLGLKIKSLFNKPCLIKVGTAGNDYDLSVLRNRPFFGKQLYKYVVKHITAIIAISSHIENELVISGIKKEFIFFIPNGIEAVDENAYSKEKRILYRKQLHIDEDKNVFIYCGRLHKQKDVLLLVKSFAAIGPQSNNSVLIIAGDGPQKNEIEVFIKLNNLQKFVFLAGYQNNVFPYLVASDFFVLSTKSEGLSNALLEAMNIGLIPISSEVSGSVDLITNGENGFITQIGSEDSIKSSMEKVLNLSKEQLKLFSNKSRAIIKKSYQMDIVINKYIELYDKLLREAN